MKSNRAKSLQRIGGTSMLHKICSTAGKISPKITLVVGFDKDSVIKEVDEYGLEISIAEQPKAIGTGDAVKCGISKIRTESTVLVLYGDVPLIQEKTLRKLIEASNNNLSILTTVLDNPYGYGRVKKTMMEMLSLSLKKKMQPTKKEKLMKYLQVFYVGLNHF